MEVPPVLLGKQIYQETAACSLWCASSQSLKARCLRSTSRFARATRPIAAAQAMPPGIVTTCGGLHRP